MEEDSNVCDLKPILTPILDSLFTIKESIMKDIPNTLVSTPYGKKIVPVGNQKLKVVEWIHSLIYLKEEAICKKFQEIELPKGLLELMKRYEMNSLLHCRIYNVFSEAINLDSEIWTDTFVKNCELPSVIIELNRERKTDIFSAFSKSCNKVYSIFLFKLATLLLQKAKLEGNKIAEILASKSFNM